MEPLLRYSFKNFVELNEKEICLVWRWRNDPIIRQWMYDKEEILFENHLKFIDSLKNSATKKYWIVLRNEVPIGVSSIVNIENEAGEWGYYIGPEFHEKNFIIEFYYYSLQMAFEELKFEKLCGYALVENKAANSLNDLFGFTKRSITKNLKEGLTDFYYRELDIETWLFRTKLNPKIHKLLDFTKNKI